MDSPAACASCAMPTADMSNYSAMGTLHPHHSATFFLYVILHCPNTPSQKIAHSHPTVKSHSSAVWPTPTHTQNDVIGTHTLNFYCYYLFMINQQNLPYLHVITNAHTAQAATCSIFLQTIYSACCEKKTMTG